MRTFDGDYVNHNNHRKHAKRSNNRVSLLGNTKLGNTTLGNTTLGNTTLGNITLGNTTLPIETGRWLNISAAVDSGMGTMTNIFGSKHCLN